ncbi:MAG TPA: efflux RND transporter periplasmic adaptor subunit [Pseudonocardia sp.]|jgi:multidrug resistance efflux pump|nr:efflux RND transporter periplasmic adaptor subunit [Pseudonocardia sp.]
MKGPDATSGSGAEVGAEVEPERGAVLTAPAPAAPPPAPAKKRWKRSTKIGLAIVAVVSLLETAAFAGTFFLYSDHYVSTDNAQVDGDKVDINAPQAGVLTRWTIQQGSTVTPNEVVGRIAVGDSNGPQYPIKAPGHGTVAVNNAVNGQYVTAGTELATAYDFNNIYVTARVAETDVRDVHLGQPVDIAVDAFPGVPVTGVVVEIQASSAGSFSFFPGPDTDPSNPQKVDQYIPVKILFTNTGGVAVTPGMSVTVHIHKQ